MSTVDKAILAMITDPVMQQRLAKEFALQCFRNTFLEELHSGPEPISECGDYSDVEVRTKSRVIPWNEVSRISQDEMRILMKEVVNLAYKFIRDLFDDERCGKLFLRLAERDPVPKWDTPKEIEKPES